MATILIVDDSLVMRKKLRAILTNGGHEVVGEADNGKHALREYSKLMPEIVTMDITMPQVDGIESVKNIINKHPDAKIIMVSAVGQKALVVEAIQNGAVNYIIKPIEDKKVVDVVNTVYLEEICNKKRG